MFESSSGHWQWLATKPASINGINRLLWRESVPSLSYFVMLGLSGAISSLGLLAGSTATVIGAMIIAPLMGPMIGIAYAIAAGNRRLLKRAGFTLILSLLVTVGRQDACPLPVMQAGCLRDGGHSRNRLTWIIHQVGWAPPN